MIVGVTGSRWYEDEEHVWSVLDHYVERYGPFTLYSGGATGVDSLAVEWAIKRGYPHKEFHAQWNTFGKAAGPIRNRIMVGNIDLLLAFEGGRGTKDCVKAAEHSGVAVIHITKETHE